MHELTANDLGRSRLHLFWIQLLFTLGVGVLVVSEIAMAPDMAADEASRYPLGSLPYLAVGLQITTVVLAIAVWFTPTWTLAWMVPVAWLIPVGASEVPTQWRLLAAACVGALAWMALRSRRARPAGPRRQVGGSGGYEESWAFQGARLGWLAVAGGVVLAAGLLVTHQVLKDEVRDFEARAETTMAEVVSYDDVDYEMVVRLDSREFTVDQGEWFEVPQVGDSVPVLVDPEDPDVVVPLASLEDPSWVFGLAVAAPLVGLWFGVPIILRARRRRALVAHGAAGSVVRLSLSEEGNFRLLPTDSSGSVLEVGHLAGLVPAEQVAAFISDWEDRLQEDEEDEDDEDDEPEPLPESDAELADWADDVQDMWRSLDDETQGPNFPADMSAEEKLMAEADFGPDVRSGEPFVMLGPWSHGSTVALLRGTGQVWLAEVRQPRFRTGPRPRFPWLRGTGPGGRPAVRRGAAASRAASGSPLASLEVWANANSSWLRWVVALVTAAVAALVVAGLIWLAVDDGGSFIAWIRPVLIGLASISAPLVAMDWAVPASTGRVRRGLISYGFLSDEVVTGDRVVSVIAGTRALALRLKEPEDALVVLPEDVSAGLEPEQAAEQLRSWFVPPNRGRSHRRPSPVLVAGVLQLALTAVLALWFLG